MDLIRKSIETLYMGKTFQGGSRFRKLQTAMNADGEEYQYLSYAIWKNTNG